MKVLNSVGIQAIAGFDSCALALTVPETERVALLDSLEVPAVGTVSWQG